MPKNVLSDIKGLTSMDIDKLSNEQLVDLVARGSKSLAQNIRRLRRSDVASQSALLKERDANNKPVVTERKAKSLQNWTKTQLKKELRKIKNTASAKTSSIKGTKQFNKEFKERTGVEYGNITSKQWSNIRQRMEEHPEYNSDDIISQYEEEYDNEPVYDYEEITEEQTPFFDDNEWL